MEEIWKDIPEYEGLYQVSNLGKVKSLARIIKTSNQHKNFNYILKEKIIKPRIDKKGYIHYALNKNGQVKELKAHRLVAQAFIPNLLNKPQINHIDGNKQNNCVDNLEWCTNSENQKHSYKINPNRKNIFRYNNPRKKVY